MRHSIDAHTRSVLGRYWGFDSLRPLQAEAVCGAIAGRDLLVVMPTGGGKSLCYQLPACADTASGLTVVVSPLISLMKDQIDALALMGYPAAALNSAVDSDTQRDIEHRVRTGEIRLLYTSPERLTNDRFRAVLARAAGGAGGAGVERFAIDEAHCISQWGHDFRREYRRLAEMRVVFPRAAFSAFTATATPAVRQDIARQLALRDPLELVGTFDRPNLTYRVVPKQDRAAQIADAARRHPDQATIVYCISRKDTEAIAAALTRMGVRAEAYHAGLSSKERQRIHGAFSNERLNVVVATVAFGMGIDRSDVRCVVHESMPRSIEHYQQETGRAGRDGLGAECVLLYSSGDIMRWQRLIAMPSGDGQPADPAFIAHQHEHLEHVRRFAAGARCRHAALSNYFGQTYPHETCGACDICLGELRTVPDAHDIARKVISCVARCGQRFGGAHVADVLRGSNTQRMRDLGHDTLSTFGLLRGAPKQRIVGWIDQLIDAGHLARTSGEYPLVALTDSSMRVLRNEETAALLEHEIASHDAGGVDAGGEARRERRPRTEHEPLGGLEHQLFEQLRVWRRAIASRLRVPPFMVMSDVTLGDLCRHRPSSHQSLLGVRGIGHRKASDFGDELIEEIATLCAPLGLSLDAQHAPEAHRAAAPSAGSNAPATDPAPRKGPTSGALRAFPMFARGDSIQDVSAACGVTRGTVVSYLCSWIEHERPGSIEQWVDTATEHRVRAAIDACGDRYAAPIHDHLNGTVHYDTIRIVLASAKPIPAP